MTCRRTTIATWPSFWTEEGQREAPVIVGHHACCNLMHRPHLGLRKALASAAESYVTATGEETQQYLHFVGDHTFSPTCHPLAAGREASNGHPSRAARCGSKPRGPQLKSALWSLGTTSLVEVFKHTVMKDCRNLLGWSLLLLCDRTLQRLHRSSRHLIEAHSVDPSICGDRSRWS